VLGDRLYLANTILRVANLHADVQCFDFHLQDFVDLFLLTPTCRKSIGLKSNVSAGERRFNRKSNFSGATNMGSAMSECKSCPRARQSASDVPAKRGESGVASGRASLRAGRDGR
jgi:hypothetical protein